MSGVTFEYMEKYLRDLIPDRDDELKELEDFAKEVDLKASNLSRLQSGDHNPTILTLLDLAYRCGYDVEVKVKKKKLPK